MLKIIQLTSEDERWEDEGGAPAERIRCFIHCFIHILIANRAKILRHGCPLGTLSGDLAKLDHLSLAELQARVADAPFVAFKVVEAEILEISPSRADERLAFLLA
ncbi:hypothetical protein [Pseudoduganella violacea]|uniref:Uncharacterized protein n=1 Tax=Pseudoduganella violacea TaxID=1715466 RepID=A0A7W5B822_9BURK|nr:hypothetical protein [Pseudoduganella violacea]MBB3118243.1 hypothetical protein [Pseudoduganella violacea]